MSQRDQLSNSVFNCICTIMQNERAPRVRAVPAVTRAIAMLRLLSRNRAPMSLKSIADRLGLVRAQRCTSRARSWRSSCCRSIRRRSATGLASACCRSRAPCSRTAISKPRATKARCLSSRYGVTAIGVELGPRHMIVVALSRAQAPVRLHVDVGSRFPALISATGRCLAAFEHPAKEIEGDFASCAGIMRRATTRGKRKSQWCAVRGSASIRAITLPGHDRRGAGLE